MLVLAARLRFHGKMHRATSQAADSVPIAGHVGGVTMKTTAGPPAGGESPVQSWKRGNEALAKENFALAIRMYFTCVTVVPENLLYRQSLRFTEYRKYDHNKKGANRASPLLAEAKAKMQRALMSEDWV